MKITIKKNRSVYPYRIKVSNQYENKTNFIEFDLDVPEGNKYLFVEIEGKTVPYPLSEKFEVGAGLSWTAGEHRALVAVSNVEIVDNINKENTLFLSDEFILVVDENFINPDDVSGGGLPEPLKVVYDELLTLKNDLENKVESGYFEGESAYQIAVRLGFKGTEQEWIESLKYDHSAEFQQLALQVERKAIDAENAAQSALESKTSAEQSSQSASESKESARQSAQSAIEGANSAKESASSALQGAASALEASESAKQSAFSASGSAQSAKEAETSATQGATSALQSANSAKESADSAKESATSALEGAESASQAKGYAEQAKTSETNASKSAEAAKASETATWQVVADATVQADRAKTEADRAKTNADKIASSTQKITENAEQITQIKEDITNIKKKKNVILYVGSSELSDEQKLSCDYVCDGVDDQIEISQAIDSLPDSGGEIHLSRGIFNISNEINIRKRIKLVGEGKGITLDRSSVNNGGTTLLSELTGGSIITIRKSDTLSDIKGITLSDFQIVGAGINVENNYCNGINVTTYTDCVTLERLAICHCFYGLFVDQDATVDDISATNCDFQRDTCGIFIEGQGWQTRIENNIFWDMSGRQATSGIVLSGGKNIVNGNYFGVSSLVFQDRTNAWISAKNAVSLLCNGNSFSRCTSSPIKFEAGGQFASISGNSFSEIGKAQFYSNERAVLYVDGAGTGGGRISFTNNTVFWANGDDWKTSYLAYLTNQVAQVNISNNTVIDGIGKITEDELVYKSEDSAYAITIGNNVLC